MIIMGHDIGYWIGYVIGFGGGIIAVGVMTILFSYALVQIYRKLLN